MAVYKIKIVYIIIGCIVSMLPLQVISQRLVHSFEAHDGIITKEGHIVTTCNSCLGYEGKDVVIIYRDFAEGIPEAEVIYVDNPDSTEILSVFASADANTVAINIGKNWIVQYGLYDKLLIYKNIDREWKNVLEKATEVYLGHGQGLKSEVVNFTDVSGDAVVVSKIRYPSQNRIVTELYIYDRFKELYDLKSEKVSSVRSYYGLDQSIVNGNEVWINYSTWNNDDFQTENSALIYSIVDNELTEERNALPREEFQNPCSIIAFDESNDQAVMATNFVDYDFDVVGVYTSNLRLLSKEMGEWTSSGAKPMHSRNGFINLSLDVSTDGRYLEAGYRTQSFQGDTTSFVNYGHIRNGEIGILHTFSFPYETQGQTEYGLTTFASISQDGRYVLINYGADEQRLYDMSNLQIGGEVGYPEQKTILYPNPAFGDHITIGNPHYGYRSYIIYDALKRIVSYGQYPEDHRIPIVDINTSGTYILALKYDTDYIEHVRFVVLK